MQSRAVVPGNTAELLFERVQANRRSFDAATIRLSDVRGRTRGERARSQTLLGRIRQEIDAAAETIVAARQWRPAVLRVVTTIAPAPLDATRKHLHESFAAGHDPAIRAELMSSYDGFARSLALKFRHRETVDDLMQVARIGLLHAIDRFDPDMGRPFPLFARITITGELKRHIRDKTWSMRVPRSLQEDYLIVMRAVDELTGEHGDSPTIEALAERCDLSVDRVLEAVELRVSQRALSLDGPPGGESDDPIIEIGVEDSGFGQLENRELLERLLARLPDRDRRILELRFMGELTQSQIADQVGVSQMCVSRVLARTIGRLRLWARTAVAS